MIAVGGSEQVNGEDKVVVLVESEQANDEDEVLAVAGRVGRC